MAKTSHDGTIAGSVSTPAVKCFAPHCHKWLKGEHDMQLTDLIPIPAGVNPGLSVAHQLTMKTLLGLPRETFGQDCRPITNPKLKALVTTANVGPFVVTGLAPAVESL